jgi:hypothetical protein
MIAPTPIVSIWLEFRAGEPSTAHLHPATVGQSWGKR